MDRNWVKPFARAGYISRGVVYLIIGFFAVLSAFGSGERTGTEGALMKLLQQPFGAILLWAMIVGLCGYVAWRLIQSLMDTDDHGQSPKGLAVRAGLLTSAGTYTFLTLYALGLMGVLPGSKEEGGGSSWIDTLTAIVGSTYISLGFALIFFFVACAHWWKAVTRKYADHFEADDAYMPFIHAVSISGLIARGIVFGVISLLAFYRFMNAENSLSEKPGITDAMNFVHGLPAGNYLLAGLGIGIMIFATYSFAEGCWRRINVHEA